MDIGRKQPYTSARSLKMRRVVLGMTVFAILAACLMAFYAVTVFCCMFGCGAMSGQVQFVNGTNSTVAISSSVRMGDRWSGEEPELGFLTLAPMASSKYRLFYGSVGSGHMYRVCVSTIERKAQSKASVHFDSSILTELDTGKSCIRITERDGKLSLSIERP